MEHLMEIMTTGTETFCIVLLLNTFFERKYTSYRFFFPLSAAFLFYLWLPLNMPHTRFAGQKNNLYNGKG